MLHCEKLDVRRVTGLGYIVLGWVFNRTHPVWFRADPQDLAVKALQSYGLRTP